MNPQVQKLEELAWSRPATAIKTAEELIATVDEQNLAQVLAICGTAYRRAEKHGAALRVLQEAEKLAVSLEQRADIGQRRAYVLAARGGFEMAIQEILQAQNLYLLAGSMDGVGRCLVGQGMIRYHTNQLDLAVLSFNRALETLSEQERRFRFSALINLACCLVDQGLEASAFEKISQAAALLPGVDQTLQWKLVWTEARLLAKCGKKPQATAALARLAEEYLAKGLLLDAALAVAEVALLGEVDVDWLGELAQQIAFSLPEESLASAAMINLWTSCIRGKIKTAAAEAIKKAARREKSRL